ncbi:putative uncharacterized protein [Novosphingobium sp. PY1]|nr:putative uncharacterized protein [Novosphingobium sp. PY1]
MPLEPFEAAYDGPVIRHEKRPDYIGGMYICRPAEIVSTTIWKAENTPDGPREWPSFTGLHRAARAAPAPQRHPGTTSNYWYTKAKFVTLRF